jgi:hypothetical protein
LRRDRRGSSMTFREFVERSLTDFEEHLRREAAAPATDLRLRGAHQFARLLLGEPYGKDEPHRKGDPTTRRFGGPR